MTEWEFAAAAEGFIRANTPPEDQVEPPTSEQFKNHLREFGYLN